MRKRAFILVVLVAWMLQPATIILAMDSQKAEVFTGQDLYLSGRELVSYRMGSGEQVLVFQNKFSMSIGANEFCSDNAVVWLEAVTTEYRGRVSIGYNTKAYMEGHISTKKLKGARTTDLNVTAVRPAGLKEGEAIFVSFSVSGEVFLTADERKSADPSGLDLYKRAAASVVPQGPVFVVQPESLVPELPREGAVAAKPAKAEEVKKGEKVVVKPKEKKPEFIYPVNIAPVGEVAPKIESAKAADQTDVATVTGRFYLWQKLDEKGGLLEIQADNAVVFYFGKELKVGKEQTGEENVLAKGAIKAIYVCGDVVMTEGPRTIRADEIYYDFQLKKAIVINAEMRSFDVKRGIPIYVRAAKLRQRAENEFGAENVVMTSSEFYKPQISATAAEAIISDTTPKDQREGKVSDSSYDASLRDMRLKMGETTIFRWPFMRSNLKRSDVPIKSVHIGNDNAWGTSLETRWYLYRLLGLREPEGVESTLALDYFSKRGLGAGAEIEYQKKDYYGKVLGYLINDSGEDRLGRISSRRDLAPDNELRGRFAWQHRQYLPYNWQLTTGIDYQSDEHFLESFYRSEFNVGVHETYVHLKKSQDNWAVSLLGKGRINDFEDELEEMPSAEYHLTGQSLFDNRFTLYSDSTIGRLRQRIGDNHSTDISQEQFTFASHRTELDMPLRADPFKVVPFVAGTFGYDDRSGFTRTLVDGSDSGEFGKEAVGIGEVGVRASSRYWKLYPDVKSRLWDLNQLRHIIEPSLTAVLYGETDKVVEQKDTLNVGVSQLLQTRRGSGDNQRTVDWMRLDTDFTFVNHSEEAETSGPDRFIWNRPLVPLRVFSAPQIFNGDLQPSLHRFEMFGPRRNYFGADYVWRASDTLAVLSDMYFDLQSSVVQQFNVGISRLCWPNLSYYIGSRYLKRVEVLDEKGSNAVTFALTYEIDPRYTLIFSQQYDFDYEANIQSEITLMRRYHRMYCSLTYSADESLDNQAIVLGIWPQGVPELAIGPRRYMGVSRPGGY